MSTGFLILMGSLLFYQVSEFLSFQKTSEMLNGQIFSAENFFCLYHFNFFLNDLLS